MALWQDRLGRGPDQPIQASHSSAAGVGLVQLGGVGLEADGHSGLVKDCRAAELDVASSSSVLSVPALHPKGVFGFFLLSGGRVAAPARADAGNFYIL